MSITLKQLRFFTALVREGHFRRAALSQGVTQPSLSAQISNLEETLGFKLIERGAGPLTLTAQGREIAARAHDVLDQMRGLEDAAAGLRAGGTGVTKIGVSTTVGAYLLPYVTRDLHRSYPKMGLFIREGTPRALEQELLDGVHDVILLQLPLARSDLLSRPLMREPLSVVMATDHPLADRTEVVDEDLAGLPVLTLGRNYALNAMVTALCLELGAQVQENYEGTSLDALRQMIAMDMGVGFLPALYIQSEIQGRDSAVVARPFRHGRMARTVGFAWRRSAGQSAAIETLITQVQTTLRTNFSTIVTVL